MEIFWIDATDKFVLESTNFVFFFFYWEYCVYMTGQQAGLDCQAYLYSTPVGCWPVDVKPCGCVVPSCKSIEPGCFACSCTVVSLWSSFHGEYINLLVRFVSTFGLVIYSNVLSRVLFRAVIKLISAEYLLLLFLRCLFTGFSKCSHGKSSDSLGSCWPMTIHKHED